MKFHHDFHHQAYINNLNKAMAGKDAASLVSLMPGAKGAKLNNAGWPLQPLSFLDHHGPQVRRRAFR